MLREKILLDQRKSQCLATIGNREEVQGWSFCEARKEAAPTKLTTELPRIEDPWSFLLFLGRLTGEHNTW